MDLKHKKSKELVERDSKVYPKLGRIAYFPISVKKGYGATIEDFDGNKYIDMLSSASSLNTGHCHPRIIDAMKKQLDNFISYTPVYTYSEPPVKLGEELCRITPGNFDKKVIYGLTGSDANDGMIKLARAYTGRKKIVSFIGAYHGSTYGAISLTALSLNMRRKIGPLLPEIEHIRYPNCYRCAFKCDKETCSLECLEDFKAALSSYIPAEEVAAIVMEPIAGDAGLVVPPEKYMKAIYKLCKENGILFVSEEVQQGIGRTGKWFGIEHFGIIPDIIVIGKSLASGAPLSAIVARSEIMDALQPPAHLFTMSGNALSCTAAVETINIIRDEDLLNKANELGQIAKDRFEEMKSKYEIIGEVRGLGLSIGVDLVTDRTSKKGNRDAAAKICYRCWEKGVILIFLAEGVLRVQPPLVISKEELGRALDIIEESMKEYLNGEIPDEVLEVAKGW
ncbi:MAG: aspartate aminotransferase family protein [Clostridiaceae bacterium]|jgi:4-aminobutyrate aminotransferase|nr:aspartate aminotransferase family protein [Clostridiaceae bacterium]